MNGRFLDELKPGQGREVVEISSECGIMCEININELQEGVR